RVDLGRPPVLGRVLEEVARDGHDRRQEQAHRDEHPAEVREVHVAGEDEDERHRAVGETAVHEAGLAALALRIPLGDHVHAGRVDHARAHAAEHAEADVRDDHMRRVRQREITQQCAERAEHHRRAGGEFAALPQLARGERHGGLEEDPDPQHPEDVRAAPTVCRVECVLGGRERVLGRTDAHHPDPREDDHPLAFAAHDVDVGLTDAIDTSVRVGHLSIGSRCGEIGGCHVVSHPLRSKALASAPCPMPFVRA
ncbi:hypothetical protein STRIP9103_09733, partial [Streptomyces ipomoeae 91-03]